MCQLWAKYEGQQWVEMGMSLKQYHKGRIQVMGQQMTKTMWATLASFMGFFFFLVAAGFFF
jgi:hypothetical protein